MQLEPYAQSRTILATCSLVHMHFQPYKGVLGSPIKELMGHNITTSAFDKYTIGQMQSEPYALSHTISATCSLVHMHF